MGPDLSELSSIASSLEQLAQRVGTMAEKAIAEHQDTAAAELVAVERALGGARRSLARLLRR